MHPGVHTGEREELSGSAEEDPGGVARAAVTPPTLKFPVFFFFSFCVCV